MKVGSYRQKVDFTKFDCIKFPLTLWDSRIYGLSGCGPNALATIVGKESPEKISVLNKKRNSCSDFFIKRYLKKHNISTQEITQCLVSNRKSGYLVEMIRSNNIVLASQIVMKNEASWFIYGFDLVIHNHEIVKPKVLDMLNWPIHTAYLLIHPEWQEKKKKT